MYKKMKRKLRNILSLSTILPIGCTFAGATLVCAALNPQMLNFNDEDHNAGAIPKNFLDLSEDGTILYGLSPDHSIKEIVDEGYTILDIPDEVEEINNYAFANIFGSGKTEKVTQLNLPTKIKKIGNGAFLNCTSFTSELNLSNCNNLTTIGNDAFNSCMYLNGNIEFPSTLTEIGDSAFRYCGSITGIKLNPELENVKYRAFANCEALSSIDFTNLPCISKWMYKEGQQIFASSGVNKVKVSCKNNTVDEWNDILFNRLEVSPGSQIDFQNELPDESFIYDDQENPNKLTKIEPPAFNDGDIDLIRIPEHTTSIKEEVFKNMFFPAGAKCEIILNTKLTEIGDRAFQNCSWIDNEITLPDTLTKIGRNAFENSGIKGTITIPKEITSIGNAAFKGCLNLQRVNFAMVNTEKLNESLGQQTFSGCTNLSCLDFSAYGSDMGSPVETLPAVWFPQIQEGEEATSPFYNISPYGYFLVSQAIGTEYFGLDKWAEFFNEEGGKGYFPANALATETRDPQSYDFNADNDKQWIVSNYTTQEHRQLIDTDDLVITRGVELVGLSQGFIRQKEFMIETDELDIPSRIQIVSKKAFKNVFLPKPVDNETLFEKQKYYWLSLHNGLIKIDDYAFADCPGFAGTFNFPSSLEYIGDHAFSQCTHMRGELLFPKSLQTIGSLAFFNCIGIENGNLNIPESTIKIGMAPFHGIKAKNIILPYQTEELSDYAFEGISGLASIDLKSITKEAIGGIPSEVYKWSQFSFAGLNPSAGTIYVNKIDGFSWNDWLRSLGLPEKWNVVGEE